jgi:hypothetical protein
MRSARGIIRPTGETRKGRPATPFRLHADALAVLAALLHGKVNTRGKRVGVTVSGGNADPSGVCRRHHGYFCPSPRKVPNADFRPELLTKQAFC